ncbi:ABC transporter permease [Membranicola marinus]|uniref:ABC transporter permease n=1 Tax=Membranihabitans marinus TaxID=1227546 RepID=A0A953HTY3_9BACT|nr:ABC transporter permease [Membranihabitans marinus]MBY5957828.1 ABC transporter permease [Membranihabitans marinus]
MRKILLIARREFLIRVKNRKFWLMTLLGPILLAVFMVVVGFIFAYSGDDEKQVVIVDEANLFEGTLKDQANFYFTFSSESLENLRKIEEPDFDGILFIPANEDLNRSEVTFNFYTSKNLNLDQLSSLKSIIQSEIREHKLKMLNVTEDQLNALSTRVTIQSEDIDPASSASETSTVKSSEFSSYLGAGIGMLMGFIMYMLVFINGSMVMRSVMEEKTNRIVEVVISSVKPFELMLGKIFGVGLIGIIQFLSWAILIPVIVLLGNLVFGFETDIQTLESMNAAGSISPDDMEYMVYQFMKEIDQVPWFKIISLFILFFIGGYLIYSSLFAAVGSAIGDDMQDSQSLVLPITIPVIMAFYIMLTTLRVPDSTLAVWSSIFPLFSPIVMPARLAFDPPWWQIILSLVLLIATVVALVWVSGRIYRVGILMYGKKASFKELGKWIFRKDI